jgi:CRP-like cAMP-binding protein
MFGYRAFFAGAPHRTTATAFEQSVVASVPMELIEQLMKENALMGLHIVRHLSVLLGQSDERTVNLTQKHIRGRLAEALLFLKDNYNVEEDGSTLGIYLSREDLASLSNMTTSNAIRTLSSFADEKLIAIDGKKIKILQEEELRKVSKLG